MKALLIDIGVNLMHRSFHPDREEVVRRAADAGFGAHLTKPVEFEKLRGAMSVVLGNPR